MDAVKPFWIPYPYLNFFATVNLTFALVAMNFHIDINVISDAIRRIRLKQVDLIKKVFSFALNPINSVSDIVHVFLYPLQLHLNRSQSVSVVNNFWGNVFRPDRDSSLYNSY